MKKKILVIGIVSMFLMTCAVPFAIAEMNTKVNVENIREQISPLNNPPGERWSKTYGGDDSESGYEIQITTDGGYIVSGCTYSYGSGDWWNVWLLKLDKSGNEIWNKTYGGDESGGYGYSVQQTNDGGYITIGYRRSGILWLIKTYSNGDIEWDKTFEDAYGHCVRQTSDGGYIITGFTDYNVDACLIKTDSQGNLEWKKTFGGNFWEFGECVLQTNDGGYIMTGAFNYDYDTDTSELWLIKTDSDGNLEWEKKFGESAGWDRGYYLLQTEDGGYIITGEKWVGILPSPVVWLIKTDSEGNMIWEKTYKPGFLSLEGGSCVQQTMDGGYIITGTKFYPTPGYNDVLLIKTDQNGNLQWERTFSRGDWDVGHSVKQTPDGGYIIAGETDGTASGYDDIWVIKTDEYGKIKSKALTRSLSFRILEKLLERFPLLERLFSLPIFTRLLNLK